jgi:hypothetical protein
MAQSTVGRVQGVILLGMLFAPSVLAGGSSSTSYAIPADVVDAGGGPTSSFSYNLQSSIASGVVGVSTSVSYELNTGYPLTIDSDGDGLSDSIEASLGTEPHNPDTDGDGLSDYDEVNADGDPTSYSPGIDTDPNDPDTDGDGIPDNTDPVLNLYDGDLAPLGGRDQQINAGDLLIAVRIATGSYTPTADDLLHGDVYPPGTPDGVIDLSDVLLIQKMVLGIP